jgi:hypothetical protein
LSHITIFYCSIKIEQEWREWFLTVKTGSMSAKVAQVLSSIIEVVENEE